MLQSLPSLLEASVNLKAMTSRHRFPHTASLLLSIDRVYREKRGQNIYDFLRLIVKRSTQHPSLFSFLSSVSLSMYRMNRPQCILPTLSYLFDTLSSLFSFFDRTFEEEGDSQIEEGPCVLSRDIKWVKRLPSSLSSFLSSSFGSTFGTSVFFLRTQSTLVGFFYLSMGE